MTMESRSRARLEFWLAIAAVVAASGAAVQWSFRIWCIAVALALLAALVVLRLGQAARQRSLQGDDSRKKAERIRAARKRR